MELTSVTSLHYGDGIGIYSIAFDDSPLSSFTYTQSTGRVMATPISSPINVDYIQSAKIVKGLREFFMFINREFRVVHTPISPYTLDISYKANKIDIMLKIGNVVAYDCSYNPNTKQIRLRRDSLDLNWADSLLWLKTVEEFHYLIEIHRQAQSQEEE